MAAAQGQDPLVDGWNNPPVQARLRAYWWWLNGNVTKEAITKDLEWMKQIGMGGGLVFDAGGATQGGHDPVPLGPLFGGPEWRELFKHTLKEADRLGLEIGLNLQSGWNLGGPLVTPERAAKVVAWSQFVVQGPTNVAVTLPKPKAREDFYHDSFVLAYRNKTGTLAGTQPPAVTTSSWQKGMNADVMVDGNMDTFWVSDTPPSAQKPEWVRLTFSQPVSLSGVTVRGRPGYGPRECEWQVSEDERKFTTLKKFTVENKQDATIRFAPVKATEFRLLIRSSYDPRQPKSPRNVQIAEIVPLDADGKPLTAGARTRPIRQLAQKSAFHELGGSATDCSPLLEDDPSTPGEEDVLVKDVLDLTDKLDKDGTLRWSAPDGTWVILRFGYTNNGAHVSTCSGNWNGLVLDYLDADAFRWYWHEVIDPIIADAGPLAGKVWKMVQTDSWELGGVNWTAKFVEEFQKRRGYDVRPWLPVLAGKIVESRDASNRFLADFRRTIADCVADNHYGTMAALAHQHGIGIQPESAGPHTAPLDGLMCYGRSDWPMSEFWVPSPHRPTDERRFFVKQASSAAHIYGKTVVCAEGFTSIGPQWNDVLWNMQKPSFDHEACAGLNLVFWHAFTCSPKEMGLPGQEYFAGTHFNPQITWSNQAHAFVSYLNRCQFVLQQGQFVADVLYYYGNHVPNIARLKQDDPAKVLPEYDYDVVNEEMLLQASVKDGRVTLPSGMSYRVLVLPKPALSAAAARKVNELTQTGAVVTRPESTKETLRQNGVLPDVEGIPDWIHRRVGEVDVYFVSNQKAEPWTGNVIFRVAGKTAELWDAVTGERDTVVATEKDGRTTVSLELAPYGSVFVVFGEKGARAPVKLKTVAEITGSWEVSFGEKKMTMEKLVDWTRLPEVRYFSGSAVYRKTFEAPKASGRLYLDLGSVSMLAEVRVNGKNVGVAWCPPWRVEITDALKASGNVLEVTVVNGWWNQLVGDPKKERTKTNIRLKAGAQPQESGLFGPVTLQAR